MNLPENILTPIGNLRGALTSGGLIPGVPVIIGEASGNPAHFEDGTNNLLIDCKIELTPIWGGSGTPSPFNERPISFNSSAIITVSTNADLSDGVVYNIDWSDKNVPSYSGYYNLTTGKMVLDKAKYKITSVTARDTGVNPNGNLFYYSIVGTNKNGSISNKLNFYDYAKSNMQLYDFGSSNGSTYTYYFCLPFEVTTKAEADQWLQSNNIEILSNLTTPIEYDLSQYNILSLEGENYINSSTGDIEVRYVINMQTFLQWLYDNLYNPLGNIRHSDSRNIEQRNDTLNIDEQQLEKIIIDEEHLNNSEEI